MKFFIKNIWVKKLLLRRPALTCEETQTHQGHGECLPAKGASLPLKQFVVHCAKKEPCNKTLMLSNHLKAFLFIALTTIPATEDDLHNGCWSSQISHFAVQ